LEYDFDNAINIANFQSIQSEETLPYNDIESCDLFIYQPIDDRHGVYSTKEVNTHLKPGCKTISFPYLYNYAFWECLCYADGDYDIAMDKYIHLNHKPITKWKDRGLSFEQIEKMIRSKNFDWDFKERYEHSQQVLRDKEATCDIKVADFIDQNHRTQLLFYTNNHPSLVMLTHVAKQMIELLDHDPSFLPHELPYPDYAPTNKNKPEFSIGWFSWNYYKFTFIPEPDDSTMNLIIRYSRQIYNGNFVNVPTKPVAIKDIIPIVCYSHSDYFDILNVQNTFLKSYDVPKIFMLNKPVADAKVVLYDETKNYSKRVLECLEQIEDEYILFLHDMDIVLRYSPIECAELVKLMRNQAIDRVDLQYSLNGDETNMIPFRNVFLAKNSSYVYNVNPSIWKRSAFMDIMKKFDYSYRDIEKNEVQSYMSKFNVYRLWSIKPPIHTGYYPVTDWFVFLHITHQGKLLPKTDNRLEPWLQVIYTGILNSFSFKRQIRTSLY
jgi:hypothetical protein